MYIKTVSEPLYDLIECTYKIATAKIEQVLRTRSAASRGVVPAEMEE